MNSPAIFAVGGLNTMRTMTNFCQNRELFFSELAHLTFDRRSFAQESVSRNVIPVVKALVFSMADDKSDDYLSSATWKSLRP
jgi:hypothetical protein